jgi:predicted DNA-binding WGR domain protein
MLIYQWLNKAKERFYQIIVQEDSDKIRLDYTWGSCNTNRGGKKNLFLCSKEEAQKTIEKMMKRRKSRGYELVSPIMFF